MKRISILLPDELHERLRKEAYRSRMSLSGFIRSRLLERTPRPFQPEQDPLLAVAGTCYGPGLSDRIDEELYGIPESHVPRRRK